MTEEDKIEQLKVFEQAAELFGVLSTPIRLRVISALCDGEKNVSQLLEKIDVSQSNMSQQLNMMYRAGVLTKRRDGAQIFYRVANETAMRVCRSVCNQIATNGWLNGLKTQ